MASSAAGRPAASRISLPPARRARTEALLACLALALGACGHPSPASRDTSPPGPAAAPADDAPVGLTPVDARMHANIAQVRTIHAALLHDDLDMARAEATLLSRLDPALEVGKWAEPARFLREQAGRLARAPDPAGARQLATELAVTCADCHMVYARAASFRAPPMPASDGSLVSAMARHQWAADRMWLGIIAPSTALWDSGLAAIAEMPPLSAERDLTRAARLEAERLRHELQRLRASRDDELVGQRDRATRLDAILDVCAACHALTRR